MKYLHFLAVIAISFLLRFLSFFLYYATSCPFILTLENVYFAEGSIRISVVLYSRLLPHINYLNGIM
jgi:hypothetical protein